MTDFAPMAIDQAAARAQTKADYALHSATLAKLPGADALIALYREAPSFHDAELTAVNLSTSGKSALVVSNPYPGIFDRGRVIVTFSIAEVLDVDLDLFGGINILFGLKLHPAIARPERDAYAGSKTIESDVEIHLDATAGACGYLVCRGITVSWKKDRLATKAGLLKPTAPPPELLGQ